MRHLGLTLHLHLTPSIVNRLLQLQDYCSTINALPRWQLETIAILFLTLYLLYIYFIFTLYLLYIYFIFTLFLLSLYIYFTLFLL